MKQVLLIGIAPTLRYYITKKLQEVGIYVIYAETVIEAMNIMKQQPVMLIIIDYSFSRDALFNFFAEKQKNAYSCRNTVDSIGKKNSQS